MWKDHGDGGMQILVNERGGGIECDLREMEKGARKMEKCARVYIMFFGFLFLWCAREEDPGVLLMTYQKYIYDIYI